MAISPEDKLSIYNAALRHLGSRQLVALTEERKPRRVLDGIWGADNGLVRKALERGEWNFAIRTVLGDYNPSIEPGFGFRRAYDKPDDFRRLAALSPDEYFRSPLTNDQYVDEAGFWFTNHDVIFIRYVSDDDAYGMNAAAWPQAFREHLEYSLAADACETITNSGGRRRELHAASMDALKIAKSNDTMGEGVKFLPPGSWSRSRYSRKGDRN